MLTTLNRKIFPEHSALLLVNVQNDVAANGGPMHREGRDVSMAQAMVPRLERLLEAARGEEARIVSGYHNVYNTVPTGVYLQEVWLRQAKRRGDGAYVQTISSMSPTSGTAIII